MISFFPVPAGKLHGCKVQLQDRQLEKASIFPFFSRTGVVQRIMAVDHVHGELRFMHAGALVLVKRVGLRRLPEINESWNRLDEGEQDTLDLLENAYHFDPWWVLKEALFQNHPLTPALKATNCAQRFERVFFQRNLTRVACVTVKKDGESSTVRLRPEYLPTEARRAGQEYSPPRSEGVWRLDPIWLRK